MLTEIFTVRNDGSMILCCVFNKWRRSPSRMAHWPSISVCLRYESSMVGSVVRDEDLLEELYGERALPHAAVSHHHQLIRGQVVPGNHAGRHGDSYTCNTEEMLRDERRCHQFNGSTCKRSVCLRTEWNEPVPVNQLKRFIWKRVSLLSEHTMLCIFLLSLIIILM